MKRFICLTLLLGSITVVFAQKSKETSALQAMVDTERAFARMAAEQGVRNSFMAFIAEDGILFRPTAVKGKQWLKDNPPPPSDKRPLLSWQPTFADMALAGDMGYTFGPWEFKPDVNDPKPVAFGHFLTVWKKQADGSWKFAIDLGVSHPQPEQAATPWELPNNYRSKSIGGTTDVNAAAAILLALERGFSSTSASWNSAEAFLAFAANDVRLFRNGRAPVAGKEASVASLPNRASQWTWEPTFAEVSRSGDLGYSYGTYRLISKDDTAKTVKVETGNYYRIWKKQMDITKGTSWKVVADLVDPVAEPKKN